MKNWDGRGISVSHLSLPRYFDVIISPVMSNDDTLDMLTALPQIVSVLSLYEAMPCPLPDFASVV